MDTKEIVLEELAASAKRMKKKAEKHKEAYYHDEFSEFNRLRKQIDEITKSHAGKTYIEIPQSTLNELSALRDAASAALPNRRMTEETRYNHLEKYLAYERAASEFVTLFEMTKGMRI